MTAARQLANLNKLIVSSGTTDTPLTLKAYTGQTSDLLQIKNSSGTVMSKIDSSGEFVHPGTILQVVQGVLADPVTFTTANAWTAIGLSASITPRYSTSKILISCNIGIGSNGGSSYDAGFGLFRDSTQIALPNSPGSRMQTFMPFGDRNQGLYEMVTVSNQYLDSPNTTSAITYSIRAYSTNANAHYINRTGSDSDGLGDSRGISTIILMEVAV